MEESYDIKRIKNNEAVKKSREKSKCQAKQTIDKIKKLRNENSKSEKNITDLEKEIEQLKNYFIRQAGNSGGGSKLSQEDIEFLKDENPL